MPIARLCALLLVSAAAAGCMATHTVSRSDAEALARLTDDLRGRKVEIVHGRSSERGIHVRVRVDTTRWYAGEADRSVPTAGVRAFVISPGLSNPSNATLGLVAGVTLGAATCNPDAFIAAGCYLVHGLLGAIVGGLVSDVLGDSGPERVEYRLVE